MIIVRLMGGLGNLMFQYGLGKNLALKHGVPLKFDISSYKTHPMADASFYLERFTINVRDNLATPEEITSLQRYRPRKGRRWMVYNLLFSNRRKYMMEEGFDFDTRMLETSDNVYLNGYWQNEKYFIDIRGVLLKDFTLRKPLESRNEIYAQQIIASPSAVSIHIRRADYVTNPKTKAYHGEMTQEYYDKALAYIASSARDLSLFIFSDDIPWVKEHMKFPYKTTYIEGNDETLDVQQEDMYLMSLCKHHVVANSAFSWWGAWLGTNPSKIVVAPERWTNDPLDHNDRVPQSWVKI